MSKMVERLVDVVTETWMDHDPTQCTDCATDLVRRLLTAMKVPTEAMLAAADNSASAPLCKAEYEHIYSVMIAAALAEPPSP